MPRNWFDNFSCTRKSPPSARGHWRWQRAGRRIPVAFLSVLSAESRFHGVLANALTKFLPTGPVLRPIFARCPIETQNSDSVGRDRSYN